ncbi:hypothetical protein AZE42_13255 [Rhizopogon vesiculosus]|uniref:Uncharacterized protein n=1 Tax=Rhizopogon vesiculosus TaxID=180088 RepID=A0A1J8QUB6_9AGAM|nr:hypothetical protein AZE42_13255 [Rhizopogon vesiculosus]
MIPIPFSRRHPLLILIPSDSTNDYRLMQTPESRDLILDLIACNWHAKLACASRTLQDEVREYYPRFTDRIAPLSTASVSK